MDYRFKKFSIKVLVLLLVFTNCSHEYSTYCEGEMESLVEKRQLVDDLFPGALVSLKGLGPYLNAIDSLGITLGNLERLCTEDEADTIDSNQVEKIFNNLIDRTNQMKQYWYQECASLECGPWPKVENYRGLAFP